jgi:molybdopterin synthase catalytic subunit
VSAPHRGAAFDACEFAIDTLKESVPIWKKEFFDGGSQWARASQHITDVDDRGVLA